MYQIGKYLIRAVAGTAHEGNMMYSVGVNNSDVLIMEPILIRSDWCLSMQTQSIGG